jgi:hypothetical protein
LRKRSCRFARFRQPVHIQVKEVAAMLKAIHAQEDRAAARQTSVPSE